MKLFFTLLILSVTINYSYAQTPAPIKKKLQAQRTTISPKIDGILDDAVWEKAPIATDFIENRPVPGRVEPKEGRTEIKILYDDRAIYIAARMYDNPDSVVHELVSRDNIGNADFIGIVFDTFLDGVNGNGFYVTAAGVQFDAKYSLIGDEDSNWNAVWESNVKIDDKGWTAEFKILIRHSVFRARTSKTGGSTLPVNVRVKTVKLSGIL
ncbi:carbohydrate binding family 9 domain-containing protein [Pedobacter sp. UC225_65]|uniref:carbohydrate binding family 9 domain-containing protein n=1 Tax=Pedobacter sp. UC225_65 TaxID=3350173 RepID=UPI00366B94CA